MLLLTRTVYGKHLIRASLLISAHYMHLNTKCHPHFSRQVYLTWGDMRPGQNSERRAETMSLNVFVEWKLTNQL